MQIKQVMSAPIGAVSPDTSIRECARLMQRASVSELPVWEHGKPIGLLTDHDVCCCVVAAGRDPATTTAREIMVAPIPSCFGDEDCKEAAQLMKASRVRRVTVIDRNQWTIGKLTIDDLARCSTELAGEVLGAVPPHAN